MIENTIKISEMPMELERLFDEKKQIPIEEQFRIIHTLTQQGIDFFSDEWTVTHWACRQSGKVIKLNFSDNHSRLKYKLGWFRNYAKYLLAVQRLDKSSGINALNRFLLIERVFADSLSRFNCQDLCSINRALLQEFENDVLKMNFCSGYKSAIFATVAEMVRNLNHNVEWNPPILPTGDRFSIDVYLKGLKEKRPPLEVVLQFESIAKKLIDSIDDKIANSTWTLNDLYDLIAVGSAIICLGTNSRIQEVLCLSVECEYFGDESWKPDAIDVKQTKYGLIMYIEKPTRGYIKTVVPEYASVIHNVIQGIKKVTEIYRHYAKFWEERGDIQYVLDSKTQKFSESLFCFYDGGGRKSINKLTVQLLRLMSEKSTMTINSFQELTGYGRDKITKRIKKSYGDLYKERTEYDFAELCKAAFGIGRLFDFNALSNHLRQIISAKYSIEFEGKIYHLNFHQTRHFTTTVMSNNGIDINVIDSLHGRSSKGQSAVYDHPTDAELYVRSGGVNAINNTLTMKQVEEIDKYDFAKNPIEINCDMREEILELFKKGQVTGSKARAYQKLCREKETGKISMEEFEHMEWQYFPMVTVAPIRLGLCTHSWYEKPCEIHYNCLLDDYGKSCKSLAPFVHPKTLLFCDQIIKDLNLSIDLAGKREASEYRDRWIQNLECKSAHCKQIKSEIGEKLEHMQNGLLEKQTLLEGIDDEIKDNT